MYRGGTTIQYDLTQVMLITIIGMIFVFTMYVRDSRREVADLHDTVHETRRACREILAIIDPLVDEEYVDMEHAENYAEDAVEIADSHVQNDELQNRVAQLKEDIASAQSRINTPTNTLSITPLHPDVYNLPHDSIPDTSHTVEYVK